ncbi:MAG TPA: DUF72 domain-containing protein, partial [Terriglobales bacterium]|nr:DUF72 domain-containing protein [Terriglobales bacterium]
EKLETPDEVTADFGYYRLRKPEYTPGELEQIKSKALGHVSKGRDVFLYFKHEETPEGVLNAEQLLSALRTALPLSSH